MRKQRLQRLSVAFVIPLLVAIQAQSREVSHEERKQILSAFVPERPSAAICRKACEIDSECRAFTFIKPKKGIDAQCQLLARVPQETKQRCCISGVRRLQDERASDRNARAAVSRWLQLVTRLGPRSLRTKVPGLESDTECKGDLVRDRVLDRYAAAVQVSKNSNQTEAVAALIEFGRLSACLGSRQVYEYSELLIAAHQRLARELEAAGHDDAFIYATQVVAAPLLMLYDLERWRGPLSPAAQWFEQQRIGLMSAVTARRSPFVWHGMWLYDRQSGRMVGFRAVESPRNENEVDAAALFDSITRVINMGDGSCSFSEMIGRGNRDVGYLCAQSSCQPIANTPRPQEHNYFGGWPGGMRDSVGEFRNATCEAAGGSGSASSGGANNCLSGLKLPGGSARAAATVACLSKTVLQPGEAGFQCLGEQTGACSSPVDRFAKEIQSQAFSGIRPGTLCKLGQSAGGQQPSDTEQGAYEEYLKDLLQQEIYQKANLTIEEGKYLDAKNMINDTFQNEARAANNKSEPYRSRDVEAAMQKEKADLQKAKDAHDAAIAQQRENEANAKKAAKEKYDAAAKKAKGGGAKMCRPEMGNCSDNCSAAAEAARRTLECIAQSGRDLSKSNPFANSPGGCNPTVCDTFEPQNARASGNALCFGAMLEDPKNVTSRICWNRQCAGDRTLAVGGDGGCRCTGRAAAEGGDAGLPDVCAQMRCSDGAPVLVGGSCQCSGGGPLPKSGGTVVVNPLLNPYAPGGAFGNPGLKPKPIP